MQNISIFVKSGRGGRVAHKITSRPLGCLSHDLIHFRINSLFYFFRFERAVKDINVLPNSPLVKALATCHSLTKVDGKLLGHTVDEKIFEAIGWVSQFPYFLVPTLPDSILSFQWKLMFSRNDRILLLLISPFRI